MSKKIIVLVLLIIAGLFSKVQAKDKDKELETKVLEIIKNNPAFIEEVMINYSTVKRQKAAEEEFKARLNNRANIEIAGSPTIGKEDAKYKLFIFTDFECPYCKRGEEIVKELQKKHDICVVFKNNPLPFHANAKSAAIAALAAHKQNKFAAYKDLLFSDQSALNEDAYLKYAQNLGLDMDKFKADLNNPELITKIEADVEQAKELGITGTPTFYLNGIKVEGAVPPAEFEKIMQNL